MGKFGITNMGHSVVQELKFKYFGYERVSVLNGGLNQWLQGSCAFADQMPTIIVSSRVSGIVEFGAMVANHHEI